MTRTLCQEMKGFTKPAQITWALIWRATLFAPVLLVFTLFYIGSWIARFFLPVLILISLWVHDWLFSGIYAAGWILSVLLWQWKLYRNLWEDPPSLL